MYFLGIDGGGTKTDFLLLDETGRLVSQKRRGTVSYKHIGKPACIKLLKDTISDMTEGVKEKVGICLAFPNWGESQVNDSWFADRMHEISCHPIKIVNDSVAGWAGSLALRQGINLVAGTGSIAYGRKKDGKEKRAGGWNDSFSDEGSCYWLGKKTFELFSKESDGRIQKGFLLNLMREYFELKNDMDIIDIYDECYKYNRTKTAEIQKLLLESALQGDREAKKLYEEAAYELSMIVEAVYKELKFDNVVPVSYSGGLFHAGDLILSPLQTILSNKKVKLQKPQFSPVQGAALLAAEQWAEKAETVKKIIMNWSN